MISISEPRVAFSPLPPPIRCDIDRHGVLRVRGLSAGGRCVDLAISLDCTKVILSDALEDTVNYVPILELCKTALALEDVSLSELSTLCLGLPGVQALSIRDQASEAEDALSQFCASAADLSPVFNQPVTVHCMFGYAEIERTRCQPMNIHVYAPCEFCNAVRINRVAAGALRQAIFRSASTSHARTIERLCAIIAQDFLAAALVCIPAGGDGACLPLSDICVSLEKPEIGLLTQTAVQFASFEFRHGARYPPIPKVPVVVPSHGLEHFALSRTNHESERASQFINFRSFSTEYEIIEKWLLAALAAQQHTGLDVLDIGAGDGFLLNSLAETIHRYVAFEPDPAMMKRLAAATQRLPRGIQHDVVNDIFTAHNSKSFESQFDAVVVCHSLYGVPKNDVVPFLLCAARCLRSPDGCIFVAHRAAALFKVMPGILREFVFAQPPRHVTAHVDLRSASQEEKIGALNCYYGSCIGVGEKDRRCALDILASSNNCLDASMFLLALRPRHSQVGHSPGTSKITVKNKDASAITPRFVAHPSTIQEVCDIVTSANASGKCVSVVGGGHSDHCVAADCVALSLSRFKNVVVVPRPLPHGNAVRVGGGATLGDIARVLDPMGLMVPLGSRPSVGMGLALHGGVGHYSFLFGLTSDFVESAVIVLGNGTVKEVGGVESSSSHDDEFLYAIRGCGSLVGVIVELTLRVVPFVPLFVHYWPFESNVPAEVQLATYFSQQEEHITSAVDLYSVPGTSRSDEVDTSAQHFLLQSFSTVCPSSESLPRVAVHDTKCSSMTVIRKYADVFDAELHQLFDKQPFDFKRSVAVGGDANKITGERLAQCFIQILESRPNVSCYVHVLDCGRPDRRRVAPTWPSCVTNRHWRWCFIVTGRWSCETSEGGAVRSWVYESVQRLCDDFLGCVLPTDLGPTQSRDLPLVDKSFFDASALSRLLKLKTQTDTNEVFVSTFPLIAAASLSEQSSLFCPTSSIIGRATSLPTVIIAVCGKRASGKDFVGGKIAETLKMKNIMCRCVSISTACKEAFAETRGLDADRLQHDRDYKELHRPALTRYYEQQVASGHGDENFLRLFHREWNAGTQVLIVTGMRESQVHSVVTSALSPSLTILVTASTESRRQRGWTFSDVDLQKNERHQDFITTGWDFIFDNSTEAVPPQGSGGKSDNPSIVALWTERCVVPLVKLLLSPIKISGKSRPTSDAMKKILRKYGGGLTDFVGIAEHPTAFSHVVSWMVDVVQQNRADCIVTVESGGVIFAAPVAAALGLPLVVIRKILGGATSKEPIPYSEVEFVGSNATRSVTQLHLRRDALLSCRSQRPAFVDDTVSSGATLRAVNDLVTACSSGRLSLCVGVFFMNFCGSRLNSTPILSPLSAMLTFPGK